MDKFRKVTNGFNYVYEKTLKKGETVVLAMPPVSSNKRGINDIGWQADGSITLYGTLSGEPESENTLWQEILTDDEINKTVAALKIVNTGSSECNVIIRAILN